MEENKDLLINGAGKSGHLEKNKAGSLVNSIHQNIIKWRKHANLKSVTHKLLEKNIEKLFKILEWKKTCNSEFIKKN